MRVPPTIAAFVAVGVLAAGCGGDDSASAETVAVAANSEAVCGVVLVTPEQAAATIESAPENLVVLDVRTPEEFAEARIDGAVNLDFYAPSFADDVAALDRDVPYVVYCRSGNRSAEATALMGELGFGSVQEVDGGIAAWAGAGLETVAG